VLDFHVRDGQTEPRRRHDEQVDLAPRFKRRGRTQVSVMASLVVATMISLTACGGSSMSTDSVPAEESSVAAGPSEEVQDFDAQAYISRIWSQASDFEKGFVCEKPATARHPAFLFIFGLEEPWQQALRTDINVFLLAGGCSGY
jgi:hypothetical protein